MGVTGLPEETLHIMAKEYLLGYERAREQAKQANEEKWKEKEYVSKTRIFSTPTVVVALISLLTAILTIILSTFLTHFIPYTLEQSQQNGQSQSTPLNVP